MYDEKPETFEAMIEPFPESVRETAGWLRAVIVESFPRAEEAIYGGTKMANALYSFGGKDRVALGIQPGPTHVKLYVHDPEHLGDPPFKLEGSGKHMRHVKLAEIPQEKRDALVELMRIPVERRS